MLSLRGITTPLTSGIHPQVIERWKQERGHVVKRGERYVKGTWGQEIEKPMHYPTDYGFTKMIRTWVKAKPESVSPLMAMMALLPDVSSHNWSQLPAARATDQHNLMATLDVFNFLPRKILTCCNREDSLKTPSFEESLFLGWPRTGHMLAIVYEYGDMDTGVQEGLLIRTLTYNVAIRRLKHADNSE
jgi:hypothetical protein